MAKELSHPELCAVYQKVFDTVLGKTVLEDLNRSYGDRSSFVHGDSHGTSFKEGQRDVYLTILAMLEERQDKPPRREAEESE